MFKLLAKIAVVTTLIISSVLSLDSMAIEVSGLYQVTVPVNDQTPKTRWGAFLTGFKEVLIRKSGSGRVLTTDEVRQAYRKVTAYVQRFQYASNEDKDAESPFLLQLDFEPRLIDELIQEAGMPIWGSNRPVTILWLAAEKDFQRNIVKQEELRESLSHMIMENAQRRGIPVILPLMDLEDELSVSISDVWGRFNSSIVDASKRYAADSIVTGRISQIGEFWQAKLSYINQDVERQMEFEAESEEALMATLSDQIAENLCQKYCVVQEVVSRMIRMQISGVGNFANFKKVEKYLSDLSSIRKVEVDRIAATNVRFNVALLGDLQSVKDGVALGKYLIEESAPQIDPFDRHKQAVQGDIMHKDILLQSPVVDDVLSEEKLATQEIENTEGSLQGPDSNLGSLVDPNKQAANQDLNLPLTPQDVILYYRWVE